MHLMRRFKQLLTQIHSCTCATGEHYFVEPVGWDVCPPGHKHSMTTLPVSKVMEGMATRPYNSLKLPQCTIPPLSHCAWSGDSSQGFF